MMDGWDGGMGVLGWTLMIIFWIALVALIGVAITRLFPSSGGRGEEADLGDGVARDDAVDERGLERLRGGG